MYELLNHCSSVFFLLKSLMHVKPFFPLGWNGLVTFFFLFQGPANLEVEVTNLGSKAGKGMFLIITFSLSFAHNVQVPI